MTEICEVEIQSVDEKMKEENDDDEKNQNHFQNLSFKIVPFKNVREDFTKSLVLFEKIGEKNPSYSYLLFNSSNESNFYEEFDAQNTQEWQQKPLPKNLSEITHAFNVYGFPKPHFFKFKTLFFV